MSFSTLSRSAFAFAAVFSVSLSTPAFPESVKFTTTIPNFGIVTLDVQTVQSRGNSSLHTRAAAYTMNIMQDWSRSEIEGASALEGRYADGVNYYGDYLTYDQVMNIQHDFAYRFPDRDFRIDPSSVEVSCGEGSFGDMCDVSAEVDYAVYNPSTEEYSAGRYSLFLTLVSSGYSFVIVAEDGTVLVGY